MTLGPKAEAALKDGPQLVREVPLYDGPRVRIYETPEAFARRVALIAQEEGFRAGARAQREMEPTPEMIQAWHDRMIEGADYIDRNSIEYALYAESYRAMQRVAPLAGE